MAQGLHLAIGMTLRFVPVVLLSCCLCAGQSIAIGMIGGVRATDDVTGAATSESKRYIVGPMVEAGLPFGFGVEFDAVYRREGYRSSFSNFGGSIFSRERANSWEFPILLKYKIPFPIVKPFAEAGYAPRVIHGYVDSNFIQFLPPAPLQHTHTNTNWPASQGLVVGGGVQLGIGRLRLSPEARYTYWNNTPILGVYGDGPSFYSTQNQFDVLVGVGWKVH
jgi:hypothetical protein